jgi:[glutamine synthetase] adenylyltransferase / [glutamine synthetase]-adenylyl-L-tyrosine phosphorylase
MLKSTTFDRLGSNSPFLARIMEHDPNWVSECLSRPYPELLKECFESCRGAAVEDEAGCKRTLRKARNRFALLIAALETSGTLPVEETCRELTVLADAALRAATQFALRTLHASGRLKLADPDAPEEGCGFVILAMGKHGAGELNFSSDIDFIALYDANAATVPPDKDPGEAFVRLTRLIVNILQDITEDGYVLRTDLRLRPDPRATQIALAIEAAAIYYENLGQNWERAAMIKARAAAGDIPLGEAFVARLQPYIWRKYLDFAAVADIKSLKRQIHAVKGHGEIAVEGHNLKLGRGGIREIELFAQTQQLIAGGRNSDLRKHRTVDALEALAKGRWITTTTASELTFAYWFLRKMEHAVQMREDHQDHCVPAKHETLEAFSKLAGFGSVTDMSKALREQLETVVAHSEALFSDSEALSAEGGSLVFTGGEDDPETINTLTEMGYRQAAEVAATVRGWHFGRYNATRTKLARELLTELMPQLMRKLAETGDADNAFLAFDRFLAGLPAGIQLFSMLKANPQLLDLLCRIVGTSPRLAFALSRMPRTLDAVLDRNFFGSLLEKDELAGHLITAIVDRSNLEDVSNQLRIFVREQMFRVGVRILADTVTAEAAGSAYAHIADAAISELHQAVLQDMELSFGKIEGSSSAVVAMGKWGGREMTATSDLDLMLLYDHPPEAVSHGPRPLSAQQYFARLTQKLVNAITSPTAEGVLYEADMRLRPSGNKGPVAVSISSFEAYQATEAWTWEKMALTRARVISAPNAFEQLVGNSISTALTSPRDRQKTLSDILDMRRLMLREQGTTGFWDLKRKRGGLVEVEFITQALQLVSCLKMPSVFNANTSKALEALASVGVLQSVDAQTLTTAWNIYTRLTQILRLSLDGEAGLVNAPHGLLLLLQNAVAVPDMQRVEALLAEVAGQVVEIFDNIIGNPSN